MVDSKVSPRIYVACLAAYNAGRLHGRWIDAAQDVDDLRAEIAEMLKASPIAGAEEYAIHDHEGFGDLVGEYEDLETVSTLALLLEEHGAPFAAYAGDVGVEYATAEDFTDRYCGEWDSEEAYAQELAEGLGVDLDQSWPLSYIDWERAARDLFMGDYSSVQSPGGVYVFRDN